jgi:hypothetical protein
MSVQTMDEIVLADAIALTDPRLHMVADQVVKTFQLAAEKATAHYAEPAAFPLPADPGAVEQLFLRRFRELRPATQQRAVARVLPVVKAVPAERRRVYGELARVNLRAAASIVDQAEPLTLALLRAELPQLATPSLTLSPGALTTTRLADALAARDATSLPSGGARVAPSPARPAITRLDLRLREVRAVDETGGNFITEIGADDIALSGTSVDETGDVHKLPRRFIGEFDDGDVRRYRHPLLLTDFNVREGGNVWPKSYFVTLVLAEEDNGGLPDFINELYEKVKGKIASTLASIGGTFFGPIGAAIGYVVGQIIDWILDWWNDDIFPPRTVWARIGGPHARFGDGRVSGPRLARFSGHDGLYHLTYDWALRLAAA